MYLKLEYPTIIVSFKQLLKTISKEETQKQNLIGTKMLSVLVFSENTLTKIRKKNSITDYCDFHKTVLEILHKHAPIEKKVFLRFTDKLFEVKALKKSVMLRSKLKDIYHEAIANEDCYIYKY